MVVKSVCKWVLIGFNYDYVCHVVMLAAVILLLINMEQNISKILDILS